MLLIVMDARFLNRKSKHLFERDFGKNCRGMRIRMYNARVQLILHTVYKVIYISVA